MAQYYQIQIQHLDDAWRVASDETPSHQQAGQQLLLQQDEKLLLNDGSQVVYQTSALASGQGQNPYPGQYITMSDELGLSQQQQQQQHQQQQQQQVMLQQHHGLDPQQQQQQQLHYQQHPQDPQQHAAVAQLQQDHQQQMQQHVATQQQQAPQQMQPQPQQQHQQIYYTTADPMMQQNAIVQQQQQQQHQQELHQHNQHQQQQQHHQQQQYLQQQIVQQQQQHTLQAPPPQQQQQVHVQQAPQQQQQQSPQIVYRMQPQQTATQLHPQTSMLNNTHVIVQQGGGVLLQSPHHALQNQRIIYNQNRVLYSQPQQQQQQQQQVPQPQQPQQQQQGPQQTVATAASMMQQASGTHQQNAAGSSAAAQHHIQLQAQQQQPQMHPQARLVQARIAGGQPGQPQQQQLPQTSIVLHQIQQQQSGQPMQQKVLQQQQQLQQQQGQQQQQMQHMQQHTLQMQQQPPQLVSAAASAGIRTNIRPKVAGTRPSGPVALQVLNPRMPSGPGPRTFIRTYSPVYGSPVGGAAALKTRPGGGVVSRGGQRGGRGGARGGRGGATGVGPTRLPTAAQTPMNHAPSPVMITPSGMQMQQQQQQQKGSMCQLQPGGMLKPLYQSDGGAASLVPGGMQQPQQQQAGHQQSIQMVHPQQQQQQQRTGGTPRFRSPPIMGQDGASGTAGGVVSGQLQRMATAGGMDLEERIEAMVVNKSKQPPPTAGNATLTAFLARQPAGGASGSAGGGSDDDTRLVRTHNGSCITLSEYKKRNAVGQLAGGTQTPPPPQPPTSTVQVMVAKGTGGMPQQQQQMGLAANATSTNVPQRGQLLPTLGNTLGGGGGKMVMQQATTAAAAAAAAAGQVPMARVAPQPRNPTGIQQQQQPQQQPQQQQSQQPQQQAASTSTTATTSSAVHRTSHNNYVIHTQHVLQNRTNQNCLEKDRKSAKMLVILVSGEQRLITFTLPRESCTVQDLLEQVSVPFDSSTTIQCVENPGANIDFVVTVGFSVQESASELISRAEQSLQMTTKTPAEAAAATSAAGGLMDSTSVATATSSSAFGSGASDDGTAGSSALVDVASAASDGGVSNPSAKPPMDEVPRKVIQGFFAVCQSCGFSGNDHAKCERCRRVFPEPPKRVPCVKASPAAEKKVTAAAQRAAAAAAAASIDGVQQRGCTSVKVYQPGGRGRGGANARGGRTRSGRRAVEAEPIILTLSSDEEDDANAPNPSANNMASSSSASQTTMSSMVPYQPMPFELVDEKDESLVYKDFERGDVTDLTDSSEEIETTVKCKFIRIGAYKFVPQEAVAFTSKGIRIVAPKVSNPEEQQELHIYNCEVVKIIAHFSSSSDSMLCFYTLRTCSKYVRNKLEMTDAEAPTDGDSYFATTGPNLARRIILQFDNISESARTVIKCLWHFCDEISEQDAKNLLERADANERDDDTKGNQVATTTTQLKPNESRLLLIYPPGKGGISINTEDYICLASDQYLNDIIIDFYLKWVHNNIVPAEQRDRTFIFSTFFYKRLTTLTRHTGDRDVRQTAAQKRHARVQNWTKNVNLFEKDFIIIPINEQSHWFLAIICFPQLTGPVTFDTNQPVEPQPRCKKEKTKKMTLQIGNTTITPLSKQPIASALAVSCMPTAEEDSERDEAEDEDTYPGSDDSNFIFMSPTSSNSNSSTTSSNGGGAGNNNNGMLLTPNAGPAGTTSSSSGSNTATTGTGSAALNAAQSSQNQRQRGAGGAAAGANAAANRQRIKQPVILIFDSLLGTSRTRVIATLRDYLSCEFKAKMPDAPARAYNKENMPGHFLRVPQQNNFTDCGLFLLQYVEHFFTDPITDYKLPIVQLENWFDTFTVTRKREEISQLLQRMMDEKNGPNQVILPEIPFPTENGKLLENQAERYKIEYQDEDEIDEEDYDEDYFACENESYDKDMETDANSTTTKSSPPSSVTGGLANVAVTPGGSMVPTQGRKIVVKRRLTTAQSSGPSASSATDSAGATAASANASTPPPPGSTATSMASTATSLANCVGVASSAAGSTATIGTVAATSVASAATRCVSAVKIRKIEG